MRWTLRRQAGSSRRTKTPQRTAKSCGPGAATLALSRRSNPSVTGARKAASPGRARISCKTIARGKPGCLGCTCQTRVHSLATFSTRCCGRSRRPAFPAPSVRKRANELAKLRRNHAVRMRAHVFPRHCEERKRRSNPALSRQAGLLRFARNDGWANGPPKSASPYTASTR
jgi:hypothetical protein